MLKFTARLEENNRDPCHFIMLSAPEPTSEVTYQPPNEKFIFPIVGFQRKEIPEELVSFIKRFE